MKAKLVVDPDQLEGWEDGCCEVPCGEPISESCRGSRPTLLDMLNDKSSVTTIAAPMVRYSRLPFRQLVRKWGTDVAFTPMILADSFIASQIARDQEFTTCADDYPVVVQFASNKPMEFAAAARIIEPYVDGVDLNCGCPTRWAYHDGIGSALLDKPDLICEMVREASRSVSVPVSIKVRKDLHDQRKTIDLARAAEAAGAGYISVHGRTRRQRPTDPVDYELIRTVRESVSIPVVSNGNCMSKRDVSVIHEKTGCHGVMSARGLLANPAMFSGCEKTPLECANDFLDMCISSGSSHVFVQSTLADMLYETLPFNLRQDFHQLCSTAGIVSFMREHNLLISREPQRGD